MSDKDPFILRNSKAHEVSYSEVTGKITRKVNRIKDDPEPEAEKPDQKISAEAGQARAPELVKAAAAGRPANPTVQTAQAGQAASPGISKAAAGAGDANVLHAKPADTARAPLAMPPAQKPAAAPVVTAAVSAVNAKASNNVAPSAGIAEANVMHSEDAPAKAEAAVVVAEDHATDTNTLAIAQSDARSEKLQGPAQNAAVAHKEVAASAPAAANIMRPGQPVAKEDAPVAPPTPRSATANVVEEAVRREDPKLVYAEPVASALEPETMVSPMPGAASVVSDKKSVDEAVAPAAPTVAAQTAHPAAAPKAHATEEKATASITMKISAKVENHLHAVQAETARISQQLERLNTKFAAMEKAHKK